MSEPARRAGPQRRVLPWLWLLALVVVIGLPWFGPGFVLAYDMVWVPRLDLGRPDLWGLGSALPRAVPSDAVVAVLGAVLDAQLVQRIALFGGLLLAGVGGLRLAADLPWVARGAAVTLAVWNPYVAERLALGQWPMVLGYGALLCLVGELRRETPRAGVVLLALAGTALTPAGGLMGALAALVVGRRHGMFRLSAAIAVVNAPWVAAGLLRPGGVLADPAGIGAFALRDEGLLGPVGTALSLGGVWNADVVLPARESALGAILTVLVLLTVVLGLVVAGRAGRFPAGLVVVAGCGLLVALAGRLVPEAVCSVVEAFGPAIVLRDGSRYLALVAPALVLGFATGIAWLAARTRPLPLAPAAALWGLLLPIAALPGLVDGVSGRLSPVEYPQAWSQARSAVQEAPVGDVLVLPFSAYRAPAWNNRRPVLDPAGRFFDRPTVTDDGLVVAGRRIAGEDPRAAAVRDALRADDVPTALADEGIGVVVIDTTAGGAGAALRQVDGLTRLLGGELEVYGVAGSRDPGSRSVDRVLMVVVWLVWVGAVVAGLVFSVRDEVGSVRGLRSAAGGRPAGGDGADPT